MSSGFSESQYATDDSVAAETGSLIQRPIALSRRPSGNQLTQLVLEDGGAFSRFEGGGSAYSSMPGEDHLGMMGMDIGGVDDEGDMDIGDLEDEDGATDGGGGFAASSNASAAGHAEEQTGRWTKEEHQLFLAALKKYGKVFKYHVHFGTFFMRWFV